MAYSALTALATSSDCDHEARSSCLSSVFGVRGPPCFAGAGSVGCSAAGGDCAVAARGVRFAVIVALGVAVADVTLGVVSLLL